ncbi:MAG: aryl-sulfate sulfotransferase [Planctomycetes bacterium]|nr:aryl-sulfate sulfotransferase [Planctomycetota bacterium]
MNKIEEPAYSRILIALCLLLMIMSINTGSAQGNMLNPVEIMSSLTFSVQRLPNGNTMITVCYSISDIEIVEVDGFGRKVWNYEGDLSWTHSANWCSKTDTILISDTNNDRVIEINRDKEIIWTYDTDIKYPNDADRLENGNTLITVRDSDKIIEVTPKKRIVWEYSGVKGPHNADRLANGNTIIANSMDNKIVEVDVNGNVVWSYEGELFWPRDADRLANGNILIADTRHRRVIEVDKNGKIVWEIGNLPSVYDVDRLENGNTLISADLKPGQVIEVDKEGRIVWRWISSNLMKQNGFQYNPSERISFLRMRIRDLLSSLQKLQIPKNELIQIRQLLNLARKAMFERHYELNKKLVVECLMQLEELALKYQKCEKGTIKGKVLDAQSRKPIANAEVFLFGTIYLTETDENGNFNLPFIPIQNAGYSLIIRKDSYFEMQKGNVVPELPYIKIDAKTYLLDKSMNEANYRYKVLTVNVAFLRKHLQKDKYSLNLHKLELPEKYPLKFRKYLKFATENQSESKFLHALASEVIEKINPAEKNLTDIIVITALKILREATFFNVSASGIVDDVTGEDWQRYNGRFGDSYNSAIKGNSVGKKYAFSDSHLFLRRFIDLLRILNVPARLAWVKSYPVVQWWAKTAASDGRWLNTDAIRMLSEGDADSWNPKELHNVPMEDITLACTHKDFLAYFDWKSDFSGLWAQNYETEAFFLHNDEGLMDAKFSMANFEKRGLIAGRIENYTSKENESIFSFSRRSYEVFDLGVNISLANKKDGNPIKFYVPVPADTEFVEVVDVKFFCSEKSWIKSIETIEKSLPDADKNVNPDTNEKSHPKTNEKIKLLCLTILPK